MITRMSGKSGLEVAFPSHQGTYGTCDFMTKICKKECPSWNTERDKQALLYFEKNISDVICDKLESELKQTSSTVLSWFIESGDCPVRLTAKIISVIKQLAQRGISQNGFTRNKRFWEAFKNDDLVHICLTVENPKKAKLLINEGLIAFPEYDNHRVRINESFACGGGVVITCGCGTVDDEVDEYEEDCSLCEKRKVGCYGIKKEMKEVA